MPFKVNDIVEYVKDNNKWNGTQIRITRVDGYEPRDLIHGRITKSNNVHGYKIGQLVRFFFSSLILVKEEKRGKIVKQRILVGKGWGPSEIKN
jgi:hypothetical protein